MNNIESINETTLEVEKEEPISSPQETSAPSALENLCQDLQSELNKYKRFVVDLKRENSKLKEMAGGEISKFPSTDKDLNSLHEENEKLKNQINNLQDELSNVKEKRAESTKENQFMVKQLEEEVIEKETKIKELENKLSQKPESTQYKGPMSELIDDLQAKINKLKLTIKEKNKIIEELQQK
ncbi:MAG: hypothetical protein P8Y70_14825 [Candidatus Lokiarchaeota archaeon]